MQLDGGKCSMMRCNNLAAHSRKRSRHSGRRLWATAVGLPLAGTATADTVDAVVAPGGLPINRLIPK
jgi:hypothetical protein